MWKMSNGHRIHSNSWDGIRGNWHILLLIYDWLYNMTFIDNQITLGYTIPINAIWVFRYISKIRVHFGFAIKKSQRHRSVNWWDIMIRFDIEHAEWHIVIFSRKSVRYRLSLNAVKTHLCSQKWPLCRGNVNISFMRSILHVSIRISEIRTAPSARRHRTGSGGSMLAVGHFPATATMPGRQQNGTQLLLSAAKTNDKLLP